MADYVSLILLQGIVELAELGIGGQQLARGIALDQIATIQQHDAVEAVYESKAMHNGNDCLLREVGFNHTLHDRFGFVVDTVIGERV